MAWIQSLAQELLHVAGGAITKKKKKNLFFEIDYFKKLKSMSQAWRKLHIYNRFAFRICKELSSLSKNKNQ